MDRAYDKWGSLKNNKNIIETEVNNWKETDGNFWMLNEEKGFGESNAHKLHRESGR